MRTLLKFIIGVPLITILIGFSLIVIYTVIEGIRETNYIYRLIEEAERLSLEEKYEEAIKRLELAQGKAVDESLKQKINTELEKNKKLLENKEKAKKEVAQAKRITEKAQREIEKEKTERIRKDVQKRAEKKEIQERITKLEQELKQKIAELQQKQQVPFSPKEYKVSEIVEYVGEYIVKIVCFDTSLNLITGSGIIYALGSKGETIILTNYHISEYADLTLEYPCIVLYSSDPTKGFTDFYFAEPVYYPDVVSLSTMKLIDFNFLSIKAKFKLSEYEGIEIIPDTSLRITDYVPVVCSEDKIKVGEEIVILGYPTIGGEYLTATEGIISGFEGTYYFTTSAKVEEGNSGGGAFLKSTGCLAGIPTFVRLGRIEAFARLINMPYLHQIYLSKIWGY